MYRFSSYHTSEQWFFSLADWPDWLTYYVWALWPRKKKKKKKKKNRYFSVQNFKPLTDKVEMEQFKGAAINLSASKFCE